MLTGVTVVSVVLLAWVNELTKEPIAQANAKALSDALKEVLPEFDQVSNDTIFKTNKEGKKIVDFIVYPAKKDTTWVGTAVQSTNSNAFGGNLTILVGFDTQGNILNYSVLDSKETPGLGSKASTWFGGYKKSECRNPVLHSPENMASIVGMNPGKAELKVNKDCELDYVGRVDAITASTITSRAFLNAINAAYVIYCGQENADGATGASQKKNVEQPAETTAPADTLNTK